MCAIVDADVAHEVFSSNPSEAGDKFFGWINKGSGRLVAAGKLLEELEAGSPEFRDWGSQAVLSGKMRTLKESEVSARTERIEHERRHRSNDAHILAVAQISGARLLYTNDGDLQKDFRDRKLIDKPPGRIYSTDKKKNPNKEFRPVHRRLLARNDLCRVE